MKKIHDYIIVSDKIMFFIAMGLLLMNALEVYPSHILEIIEMLSWAYVVFVTIFVFVFSKHYRQSVIEYFDAIFPFL